MDELNVFIAYQSESEGAAKSCRQALLQQGWHDAAITMWNPSSPWAEPIFEVGRKIMHANVVLVISRTRGRRSTWVAAEVEFARRVRVPVLVLSDTKAPGIEVKKLRELTEKGRYLRLIDLQPWFFRYNGLYEILVYEELNLLELLAADRGHGVLSTMRRCVLTFEADLRIVAAQSNNISFRFLIFANFINPRGLICNLVFRPLVTWAEKRGLLQKIEPSPEFGKWRDALPNFIGNPAPFFDNFGTSSLARELWGWDQITLDLLEQASENLQSKSEPASQIEPKEKV